MSGLPVRGGRRRGTSSKSSAQKLITTHSISLLQQSMSAAQARAALRKAISKIRASDLEYARGVHLLLLM
jgi:hypothetical protein